MKDKEYEDIIAFQTKYPKMKILNVEDYQSIEHDISELRQRVKALEELVKVKKSTSSKRKKNVK